jgi:hypothetical protein
MFIIPADLLAPAGPVEETLFRDETLSDIEKRLQAYIDQAYEKINGIAFPRPDEAARLWALYLTFDAAYILACAKPGNENTMVQILGSEGYHKDQRDGIRDKRNEYRAAFIDMENALPAVTSQLGPQSRQVVNRFVW